MTDVNTESTTNGTDSKQANGHADSINDTVSVKDPNAVLAKNRELLDLVRKEKQSKSELMQKIQEIEQAKLQAEGKKDELITQLQAQMRAAQAELKKTKATYALKSVKDQVKLKASTLGCVDTDLLARAMDLESLNVSMVDDEFNVDEENLTAQLESIRKQKPFLFKQAGPEIKDGLPGTQRMQAVGTDYSKMTIEQMREMARELSKK